jgi:hypothetical protein
LKGPRIPIFVIYGMSDDYWALAGSVHCSGKKKDTAVEGTAEGV